MKYGLALVAVCVVQVLFNSTALYLVRRYKKVEPRWSWLNMTGRFTLLYLLASVLALIPIVGIVVAIIVSLIGIKRLSGLDVLSSYILSFALGTTFVICVMMIGRYFEVDLLSWDNRP